MLFAPHSVRRRGAVMVEAALVLPILMVLTVGMLVLAFGVLHKQQTAWLARDASRYACVRGSDYERETGLASPTEAQIRNNVVLPKAVGMKPAQLTIQIWWIDQASGTTMTWNSSPKAPQSTTADGKVVANRVKVTVTYQWFPAAYLAGPINLTSTSEIPMSF